MTLEERVSEYSSLVINYNEIIITFVATQFLCWVLLEILERKCGMQPAIRRRTSFTKLPNMARSSTKMRMTKSLDSKGRFRIQTRGSIYIVKTVWMFIGILMCILMLITRPLWYIDHFYYLKPSTVNVQLYPLTTAMIASYYCFEMSTNRYAKLQYSIAAHHWISVAAATITITGSFSPLLSWYAIIGIFTAGIPINLSLGFRANWAYKYNNCAKFLLKFAAYWYFIHIFLIFGGATLISLNMWYDNYYDTTYDYFRFAYTVLAACAFGYNDIITLRALFSLSKMNYKHAQIDAREPSKTATHNFSNKVTPPTSKYIDETLINPYIVGASEWTNDDANNNGFDTEISEWELEAFPINYSPQSGFGINLPTDLFKNDNFQLDPKDHEDIAYVSQMAAGLTYVSGYDTTQTTYGNISTTGIPTPQSMRSINSAWTNNTINTLNNNHINSRLPNITPSVLKIPSFNDKDSNTSKGHRDNQISISFSNGSTFIPLNNANEYFNSNKNNNTLSPVPQTPITDDDSNIDSHSPEPSNNNNNLQPIHTNMTSQSDTKLLNGIWNQMDYNITDDENTDCENNNNNEKRESNNKIKINNIEMISIAPLTKTHSALIDNISLNTIKSNESMESMHNTEINDDENKRRNSAPIRKSLVSDQITVDLQKVNENDIVNVDDITTRQRIGSAPKIQSKLYTNNMIKPICPPRRPSRSKTRSREYTQKQVNIINRHSANKLKTNNKKHIQFKGIENNIKRYSSAHNLQAQKRRSFHVSSTSHPEITFKTPISAKNITQNMYDNINNIKNLGFVQVTNNITGKKETLFVRKKKKKSNNNKKRLKLKKIHSHQIPNYIHNNNNNSPHNNNNEEKEEFYDDFELAAKQKRFPTYHKRVSKHRNYASEHVTHTATTPSQKTQKDSNLVAVNSSNGQHHIVQCSSPTTDTNYNYFKNNIIIKDDENKIKDENDEIIINENINEIKDDNEIINKDKLNDDMEISMISYTNRSRLSPSNKSKSKLNLKTRYWQEKVVNKLHEVFADDGRFDNNGICVDLND